MSRRRPADEPSLAEARRLRATTVEVDCSDLPDLARLAGAPGPGQRLLWARQGLVILGCGQALDLELPGPWASAANTALVEEVVASVPAASPSARRGGPAEDLGPALPGVGPLAMGSLPYDPAQGGHLVVPRLTICQRGERAWTTLIAPASATAPGPAHEEAVAQLAEEMAALRSAHLGGPVPVLPDGFELRAKMSHEDWKRLVASAVSEMASDELAKVVLARRVDVVANRPFVLAECLHRLAALYPSCTVFHVEGFIGASPELLVRRSGYEVTSHPLAGTIARSGDAATDDTMLAALLASPKERREHAIVVEEIAAVLRPLCVHLDVPTTPSVMLLRNVSHLGTAIKGKLADDPERGQPAGALSLAAALHPTPAVGGLPTAAALNWQRQNEGFDRGRYAGPVGWVDSRGDGEWVLGVRSAQVDGRRASLFAGNGIVTGSAPNAELAETQLKLQALLSALVRP